MKQFVIKAYDGVGKLDKRMEVRPRHFEGMEKMKEHILCAGGMLDDDGKMIGSLLVMEFENRRSTVSSLTNTWRMNPTLWNMSGRELKLSG